MTNPIDCVLAVTYKCNSRCVMCDIWQLKNFPETEIEQYKKLPTSLCDINISGGEVFLYTKLPELVKLIKERCPKAKIVLSSNGFMSEFIEQQMKKILAIDPKIGVALSLDGVGEMHEKIRRIPQAFDKVMDTLSRLQALGMKNLRLAFTVLPENVSHYGKVYNLAREYFAYGLYKFGSQTEQVLSDDPGKRFFFMDPAGLVYPSVIDNFVMGDLTQANGWNDLWQSERANEARKMTHEHGKPVWMICTARTAIKKHPFRVGWWVVRNKFVKFIKL